MKINILVKFMGCAVSIMLLGAGHCFSDSLFKAYTEKSRQELMAETESMSREIKDKFNQESMESAQQKIDYYDYFSNLKKLFLYGSKLATYAEYEEDLRFAKDNELFKGLPEDQDEMAQFTERFVNEKYKKMQLNVKDEIETYEDLIQISLDSCELLSSNDISGFVASETAVQRIQLYLENSKDFEGYMEKREKLARTWPMLESRIKRQISIWNERGMDPEDPIINRKLTEAISNEGSV
ncbi:MAG: hypothetical protein GY699_02765 [Desulfobacteraceae bacterium]|nr:hypothetical protein [Desulfobacteraceae bacterium]